MVRRKEEKECGGKCEMKAKLKVTFLLRKIKTKSLSSAEINSDNELRYVQKKKIKIRATKSTAIMTQHLSRCHRYLGSLLCLFRLVHLGIFISWWSSVLLLFSHIHLCIVSLSLRSRGLKTRSSLLISIVSFIMITTTPTIKSKQIFKQFFCIMLMFRS